MNKQRLLELAGVTEAPYRGGTSKSGMLQESRGYYDNKPRTQVHVEIGDPDDLDDIVEVSMKVAWHVSPGAADTHHEPGYDEEAEVADIKLAAPFAYRGKRYMALNDEVANMILTYAEAQEGYKPREHGMHGLSLYLADHHADDAHEMSREDPRY